MAEESDHNSAMDEFEKMLKDEQSRRFFELSPIEVSGSANETVFSTATTPDPLNTAFIDESHTNEQSSQRNLSRRQQQQQQQSQTTKETSSTIHNLIDTVIEQEHENDSLRTPTKTVMTSTGTMPKTPITMVSIGTMPQTPTIIDLVSPPIETIDICSSATPKNTPTTPESSPNSTPYMAPQ